MTFCVLWPSVCKLLMGDVEELIGAAGRHERAPIELNWLAATATRTLDMAGKTDLKIPKRRGPWPLPAVPGGAQDERGRGVVVAVIQEAWIGGVSTRRVDEIAQAMGLSSISKSQVSKLCKEKSTSA